MIVSWNWLKELLDVDRPREEVERRLMMAGLNHEGTDAVGDDFAIDLEVTSNRPDCLGHLGVAREVAVLFGGQMKRSPAEPPAAGPPVEELTRVAVECPELCPRYTARVIQGVTIGESPAWLRDRLATLGIVAINNVVDITNYVLMECGQPLHAFDVDKLGGGRIVVREPRRGEKLEAIDHRSYALEPGMCIIADGERPVGIGGVMGGAGTEIAATTTNLLIEAAEFSPTAIRNTARRLKLFSDSSHRFERGVDPDGVDWASRRCCELILDLAGGTLAAGVHDIAPAERPTRPHIVLRYSQLPRILGIDIPHEEVVRILLALGNEKVIENDRQIEVAPPSWRRDLTREIDLVEEVARIYGYDQIPEDVSVPMATSSRSDADRVLGKVRQVLTAAGFHEAMTLSVVPDEWSEVFSPWSDGKPLRTSTPVIERSRTLRKSLAPNLLAARRVNETLDNLAIELFEVAHVYLPGTGLPTEESMLGLSSGRDFFAVKGVIEAMVRSLAGSGASTRVVEVRAAKLPLCGERAAELHVDGRRLGFLGELSEAGREIFELRSPGTIAELRLQSLIELADLVPQYVKPPEYPAITNDINLVVSEDTPWSAIAQLVTAHGGELVETANYQETYRNERLVGKAKKKVLFQVAFRSPQGTLTHEQTNAAHDAIVAACERELGARLG